MTLSQVADSATHEHLQVRPVRAADPEGCGRDDDLYLWDGDQLLAEYGGSGARQVRYAYAEGFAPVQVAYGPAGSRMQARLLWNRSGLFRECGFFDDHTRRRPRARVLLS